MKAVLTHKVSRKQTTNTVDPDEKAHYEPFHLDLQCLQIELFLRVKK